jgi:hypothetical protein
MERRTFTPRYRAAKRALRDIAESSRKEIEDCTDLAALQAIIKTTTEMLEDAIEIKQRAKIELGGMLLKS